MRVANIGMSHLTAALRKYGSKDLELTQIFHRPLPRYLPAQYALFKKYLRKYDVVHANTMTDAVLVRKSSRKSYVLEIHGWQFGFRIRRAESRLKRIMCLAEDLLRPIFHSTIREAKRFFVGTPDLLPSARSLRPDAFWLPNPIDLDIFKPDRDRIFLQGSPAVLFPTRLEPEKGPMHALQVFSAIKNEFPDAVLHLIDWGVLAPYYGKALRSRNYVWHKAVRQTQPGARRKLASLYRGADLILGQFRLGTLGNIELEAMACGTPLVTYDEYEIFVGLDDCIPLALSILSDEQIKIKMVSNNRSHVEHMHCDKKIYSRLLEIYRSAVER